ncbi:MAG: putative Multicopper oxidase [Propionibacteriaceae bacterium]|jgi:FtsP/CotA-like multicopper oxidase with cupredoxin domain|nr:putative Multicopper oxidase [Propionibacteriaceae bacterium]
MNNDVSGLAHAQAVGQATTFRRAGSIAGRRPWQLIIAFAMATALVLLVGRFAIPTPVHAEAETAYVPQTRTYFIAADEVVWDYAPSGKDDITGQPLSEAARVFTQQGPDRIGHKYIKAVYRAYTDATFSKLAPVPAEWQHLGLLGPVIRGVVGDTIKVVFRNNTDKPASIHVHGVKYAKDSEGAPYDDGTKKSDKRDDAVAPKGEYTYSYEVPERAGPGPMDGSSVMWMYHSHTDEVSDDYSGLVGPIIITAADQARPDGTPIGVDREIVLQYKVSDENQSPYLARNIKRFATNPASVNPDGEEFYESNLMHSINGYVYGNQPLSSMTMKAGEHVRWYLMGMGTEVDLHTPHWHGNTVVANGMRTDVVGLLPATMMTADMTPDAVGTWLLHCHVNDHITAGMVTRYRVVA